MPDLPGDFLGQFEEFRQHIRAFRESAFVGLEIGQAGGGGAEGFLPGFRGCKDAFGIPAVRGGHLGAGGDSSRRRHGRGSLIGRYEAFSVVESGRGG